MKKHNEIILKKMFSVIGKEYSYEFVQQPNWFSKFSWNKEQKKEFFDWLTEYLMSNKEAREEIMRFPTRKKKDIKEVCNWIDLQMGWKDSDPLKPDLSPSSGQKPE